VNGVAHIQTAAEAAKALEPLAGRFPSLFFSLGIIGTGLLATPVLAGSAAYGVGEALNWTVGLEKKPKQAKGFYGIIIATMLVGLLLNLLRINPIQALFWTAVINGVAAVPFMIAMMFMTTNPKVMGNLTLSFPLKCMGWITTLVMLAATAGLCFTFR